MKKRIGFVSNSSSSSFIINKDNVSQKQINKIYNHIKEAKGMSSPNNTPEGYDHKYGWDDTWNVTENEREILMDTTMDNFDMYEFLIDIGVDKIDIEFGDGVWG